MNVGGLGAILILSGLILRIRWTRFRGTSESDRASRRHLGVVAMALPVLGLVLPFLPWRLMTTLIVTMTVGSLMYLRLSDGIKGDGAS